jgi:hypothetical protein
MGHAILERVLLFGNRRVLQLECHGSDWPFTTFGAVSGMSNMLFSKGVEHVI